MRKDFLDLLEVFAANRENFTFAILTNGSFIDAAMARQLRKLGPAFVQVSVEGTKTTHDRIRGAGNFDRTVSALKYLVKERIRALISFTAHRDNFREFSEVARLGRKLRASRVWADRLIPSGTGLALKAQMLTPDEQTPLYVLQSRLSALEAALHVTDLAMRACGGAAFSRHLRIEQMFRDARAGWVMAPTVDHLQEFVGRALTGLPLF